MQYVRVADTSEVPPGSIKAVEGIDRVKLLIINKDGRYFALSGVCSHKGAPMERGKLKRDYLECPWHGALFKLETGRHSWPAPRDLRSYPLKVSGSDIYVGVSSLDTF
ncbi:MAG: Rieske (2Fe-2S) protein [Rhabdochlamydiaceae bacterium]